MVKIVEKSAEERERDRKRNEQYEVLVSLTGEVLGLKEDQGINTLMRPLAFRIMDKEVAVYLQSHLRLGDRVVVVSNLEDRDLAGRLAQIYEERTGQEFTLYQDY